MNNNGSISGAPSKPQAMRNFMNNQEFQMLLKEDQEKRKQQHQETLADLICHRCGIEGHVARKCLEEDNPNIYYQLQ